LTDKTQLILRLKSSQILLLILLNAINGWPFFQNNRLCRWYFLI